jgi:hypothetical protein
MTYFDVFIVLWFLFFSPLCLVIFLFLFCLLYVWNHYRRRAGLTKTCHRLGYQELCTADPGFAGECSICLDTPLPKERVCVLSCGCRRAYHDRCISDWFGRSATCPNCRRDLSDPAEKTLYQS